jgi:hypothetical protein
MKIRLFIACIAALLALLPLSAQNVGIHTNSPAAPFHIGSSGQVQVPGGLTLLGNRSEGHMELDFNRIQSKYGNFPLGLALQDLGGAVGIGLAPVTNGPRLQLQHDEWHLEMRNNDDGTLNNWYIGASDNTWSAGDNKLVFSPTSVSSNASLQLEVDGNVLLVPQELGAVGIGVTSSNFMPDGFLLAVDGKAIFEEARVQLSGDWPDYVFKQDYQLLPLELLEMEIDNLGHLPGIPSAKMVESEGFDLGEMQRRMLEKVEELTLYIIAADKEIAALKAANTRLEESMKNYELRMKN